MSGVPRSRVVVPLLSRGVVLKCACPPSLAAGRSVALAAGASQGQSLAGRRVAAGAPAPGDVWPGSTGGDPMRIPGSRGASIV